MKRSPARLGGIRAKMPSMVESHSRRENPGGVRRRGFDELRRGQPAGSAALVSVVVPCYNQAHFLGEAIESVLSQSYPDSEIVVVDDGSTDDTSEVAGRYPKVRLIRQENRGLSGARNVGLTESEGEYVVFLDADDRLLPEALEVGLEHLRSHPERALVSGNYRLIAADGSPLRVQEHPCPEKEHYVALLRYNHIGMHAAVMYRRSVFEAVGGFDTSLRACEDYDLFLRIARKFPIYCHGKVVAEYRQHGANMSCDPALMLKTALAVLRSQREYVKGSKHHEEAYRAGLRYWRGYYGAQLAHKVLAEVRKHEWRWALRDALVLLRYHPGMPIRAWRKLRYHPPVGWVRFGSLRRVTPVSRLFGYDRGQPIDRYYIEDFLARHAADVRGRVLEIGDDSYTRKYGGRRVKISDVLHATAGNPQATIVADLTRADHIPSDAFDCIIFTQTLHLIYDLHSAIRTLYRILKPGGVLLATFPGISQISQDEWGDHWHWALTTISARRLFEEAFPAANVKVEAHGNVLAATSFLHGLAAEELRQKELNYRDPSYELLIALRAVKPEATPW
jgi:glycosyltransferase involved in cell wall biosynthesis